MTVEERVRDLIEPAIADMGYDLVRVRTMGSKNVTLQIMADRRDERPITVEDCAEISRAVSAILDVEDPVRGGYTLEVSSPGIDRPLVRARDFERFAGFEAKVEMARLIDGRKRYRGLLAGMDGDDILVDTDAGRVALPLADLATAKLVMTDELLAAAAAEQAALDAADGTAGDDAAEDDGSDDDSSDDDGSDDDSSDDDSSGDDAADDDTAAAGPEDDTARNGAGRAREDLADHDT